jgi:peptidoglycan/xylan/chitin deacetylase (PgdA/CDA1 family)
MARPGAVQPLAVLMYHEVSDSLEGVPAGHRPYVIPTASFQNQVRAIATAGVTGTRLDTHLTAASGPGQPAPGRRCVITFDDGHESNYSAALPLLQACGFRATFFITTGWVGRRPYMSWSELRALAAAGMEIGTHSVSHRPPSSLSRAELEAELRDSKKAIEDGLGIPVLTASSPTGFTSAAMIPLARDAGYRALCFGHVGLWAGASDTFGIPRIPVKLGTSAEEARRLALGDPALIRRLRRSQVIRDGLKRALGVERYLALRRWLMRGSKPPR